MAPCYNIEGITPKCALVAFFRSLRRYGYRFHIVGAITPHWGCI
jgi:hypothetical protein